MLGFD
jgi:hypothetical protein